jgi:hypothetical protein
VIRGWCCLAHIWKFQAVLQLIQQLALTAAMVVSGWWDGVCWAHCAKLCLWHIAQLTCAAFVGYNMPWLWAPPLL